MDIFFIDFFAVVLRGGCFLPLPAKKVTQSAIRIMHGTINPTIFALYKIGREPQPNN